MDMTTLASSLRFPGHRSSNHNSHYACPRHFQAIHPRWDLDPFTNDEPLFLLPDLSVSDVSESSERSERVRVEYPYLMISPEIIRDSPDERLTLYDSCLSPTTTFQGSENLKVSPIYNVGRIRRDEPSLAGLVVHMASALVKKLRKVVAARSRTAVQSGNLQSNLRSS